MEIMAIDTHIAANEEALREILNDKLYARGLDPTAAAVDADGQPLLVWMTDDDVVVIDAGHMAQAGPVYEVPPCGMEEVAFPVSVFVQRHATGALAGES